MTIFLGALSLLSFTTLLWCLSGLWRPRDYYLDERILGGFAVFLLASNTIHLFTGLSSIVAKSLIGLLAVVGAKKVFRSRTREPKRFSLSLNYRAIVGGSFSLWILSTVSAGPTLNYDANLYHFAFIEALSSERIIIGWANLHERFAVQSSVFNVAAFLENGPWGPDSYRLTGALFVFISMVFFREALRRISMACSSPGDLLIALALPSVWAWGLFQQYWFSGPSLDVPAALLAVVASSKLADFVLERDSRTFEMATIGIVVAYSLRPINLVLIILLALVAAVRCRQEVRERVKKGASLPIALFLVLVVRSFLLSGFPLAPLTVGFSGIHWSIEGRRLEFMNLSVRSWARRFGGTQDLEFLSFGWLPEWWANNSSAFSAFLSLGALGLLLGQFAPRSVWVVGRSNVAAIVAVGVIPTAVWFSLAPALRFGWGQLAVCAASWTLAIDLSADGREQFDRFAAEIFKGLVVSAAALMVFVPLTWAQRGVLFDTSLQLPISPADQPPALVGVASESPVELRMPRVGDQCGWEIWCSPQDPGSVRVNKIGPWWVVSQP